MGEIPFRTVFCIVIYYITFGLFSAIFKAFNNERIFVSKFDKLNIPIAFAGQKTHVRIRIVQGNQNPAKSNIIHNVSF